MNTKTLIESVKWRGKKVITWEGKNLVIDVFQEGIHGPEGRIKFDGPRLVSHDPWLQEEGEAGQRTRKWNLEGKKMKLVQIIDFIGIIRLKIL